MDTTGFAAAVAAELRAERGRKQLTIDALVTTSGISKTSVLFYLNGKRDIPIGALVALCDALDVSPTLIFERAEESTQQH